VGEQIWSGMRRRRYRLVRAIPSIFDQRAKLPGGKEGVFRIICFTEEAARYASQRGFKLEWENSHYPSWLVKSIHA
jgi:hypothetical protein